MSGPIENDTGNDIEKRLRDALRPLDPGEAFSQRVLVRIAEADAAVRTRRAWRFAWRFDRTPYPWLAAAIAASLAVVVVGMHQWHERRERAEGLEARHQLIHALRVTSDKLDLAYQAVTTQGQRNGDEGTANES